MDPISSNWLDGRRPNSRRKFLVLDGEGGGGEGGDDVSLLAGSESFAGESFPFAAKLLPISSEILNT